MLLRVVRNLGVWVKKKKKYSAIPKELVFRVKLVCRNYASFPPYIISPIVVVVGAGKVG